MRYKSSKANYSVVMRKYIRITYSFAMYIDIYVFILDEESKVAITGFYYNNKFSMVFLPTYKLSHAFLINEIYKGPAFAVTFNVFISSSTSNAEEIPPFLKIYTKIMKYFSGNHHYCLKGYRQYASNISKNNLFIGTKSC